MPYSQTFHSKALHISKLFIRPRHFQKTNKPQLTPLGYRCWSKWGGNNAL